MDASLKTDNIYIVARKPKKFLDTKTNLCYYYKFKDNYTQR